MQVRFFTGADASRWDDFVRRHPHGSPFHLTGWKSAMEATFGYEPKYLLAEDNGQLVAVLPLFLISNFLAGRILLSTPFAVYGGVLASSPEALLAVQQELERLGRELRVDYTELRNAWPDQCLGYAPVSRYVTFTQELPSTEEEILETIPRKTRRMVRKSLEHAFKVRLTRKTGDFERLYLTNLRKLGTPAFPHKHFENLLKFLGEDVNVCEVVLDDQVVAAVMTIYFRDQVLPYYGAADSAMNAFSPTSFMYFDQMRRSAASGYKIYDFGRSKKDDERDAGSYGFKIHWGMVERQLPYEILLGRRKELPNLTPKNPKFRWAMDLWRKAPLPVTKALGPLFIRMVP